MKDNITYNNILLNAYGNNVDISEAVIIDAHIFEEDKNDNVIDCNVLYDKRSNSVIVSITNKGSEDFPTDEYQAVIPTNSKEDVLEFANKLVELGKNIREVCER